MHKIIKIYKITHGYVYKIYLKYKWILCSDVGPSPNISHSAYVNIPKSKLWNISTPKHSGWGTQPVFGFLVKMAEESNSAFKIKVSFL
jgi:hypothetical protein